MESNSHNGTEIQAFNKRDKVQTELKWFSKNSIKSNLNCMISLCIFF